MKIKKYLTIFFFVLFCNSTALAVDTRDWEGILGIQFFAAKPQQEWILQTANMLLKDAFSDKEKENFKKFLTNDTTFIIPIKSGWHDLTSMMITYSENDDDYLYMVGYEFKKGSMSIIDVLSRYESEIPEINTKEDLSKEISYKLTKRSNNSKPFMTLVPLGNAELTMLKFSSKDKVYIDKLVLVHKKPKSSP